MSDLEVFNHTLLNRFSSWLQGTIIFPNAIAISGAFWIAYAWDPELAYNSWDHRYRPFYLCHVQHSFILLFSMLEAFFRPHRIVKKLTTLMERYRVNNFTTKSLLWNTVMPSMIFWYLYTIWLIHIHNFTGQWVYPFFSILDNSGEFEVIVAMLLMDQWFTSTFRLS